MSDKQHPAELLAARVMHPGFSADELADEIAEQLRRIPYLEAERDSWQQQASDRLDDAVQFAAERDALRAEVKQLKKDAHDDDMGRRMLGDLLTRTVNAIRGDPAPLCLHSWHDLPERAGAAMASLAGALLAAKNAIEELERERAFLRATSAGMDAALEFAGTVAGGASWWDDVWAVHEAAIDAARDAARSKA